MNRREFASTLTTFSTVIASAGTTQAQTGAKPAEMNHPMPAKPEEIAMLIYPGMTALDLIGPQQVFGYLMGCNVHLVAKTMDVVTSDTGVPIKPTKTFAECPDAVDILFVPGGGIGTINLMKDAATLAFLADRAKTAQWVTSVCSGSLVLAAAGLLRGYKATSHWSVRDVLADFGAEPVHQRVVEDRNRITSAGITAGIDFGLRIAGRLRGLEYAQALELTLEYDPQPPFHTGTPETAPSNVLTQMKQMYAPLAASARAVARQQPRSLLVLPKDRNSRPAANCRTPGRSSFIELG
ncbi:MAG TPA: DJ-1/PfpI family protein [Bryobacteraceae bacterium]|nr:DJ-1/PfpI family protein [Bryobacteraceae bacterium]